MCEHYAPIKRAWKGWLPMPEASGETGAGPWTDLTHVLTEARGDSLDVGRICI